MKRRFVETVTLAAVLAGFGTTVDASLEAIPIYVLNCGG
jgi:hypothetical protein